MKRSLPAVNQRDFNHLLAAADVLTRHYFDAYLAYPLDESEYLGHTPFDLDTCRKWLRSHGYEQWSIAAAKYHPAPHAAVDHLSFRKVPSEHPNPDTDVPLFDEYRPGQCQYHLHGYPTDGGTELFGHYERSGAPYPVDGETLREAKRRALAHYRNAGRGSYYLQGVTDLRFDFE